LAGKPLALVRPDGSITLDLNGQRELAQLRAVNQLLALHTQGVSVLANGKGNAVRAAATQQRARELLMRRARACDHSTGAR
jgi:hypothetical protein